MFVQKDTRKVVEILYDEKDDRKILKLARREAEFNGDTTLLLDPLHGRQLANTRFLSLYGNKLTKLSHFSTLCSNAIFIEEINLGNNVLTELPSAFGSLPTLQRLWIEDNKLTKFPTCLLKLTQLKILRLSGNKLTDIPEDIDRLTSLEDFAIDNNEIEMIPDAVGGLSKLQVFVARGNKITALPETFGNLKALRICNLSSNRLESLPVCIGHLESLQQLLLNSNNLTSLPHQMASLKSLTRINLANNMFECLHPRLISAWGKGLPAELVRQGVELWKLFSPAADPPAEDFEMETLAKIEINLERNPLNKHIEDESKLAIVPLTEAQYAQPLINEIRKKAKVES